MPVILRTEEQVETWLTRPSEEAMKLQRPLPDGALRIVARGEKEDGSERPSLRLSSDLFSRFRSRARIHAGAFP
jgi:putative SOS response-associated peptidase YedK